MAFVKAKTTTYEYTLAEMKALICANIGAPTGSVTVRYRIEEVGGDPKDRYPGTKEVVGIEVTVKEAV